MRHKLIWVVLLSIGLLSGCKREDAESTTISKNVKTTVPVLMSDVTVRTFAGVVKVTNEINLGFKAAGQIHRMYVKEGDYVREGDIIAELDKKDYLLQLEASQIQYQQLKKETERLKELLNRKNIPENDYEKALAGLNALGVQLQADKNTVEYTVLRSPLSGYIQSVHFAESEMVNAGTAIVTLIDVSTVKIEMELPASLYIRQEDFSGYSCKTNLTQEEEIPLKRIGINQKSNSSQLYKMSFMPELPHSAIKPGMNVEVLIKIRDKRDAVLLLPAKTVFSHSGKTYVWTVQNNVVKKCEVITGSISPNGDVVILSGITENEIVVKAGIHSLKENDPVNIIPETSETNVGGLL
ncbi:MAG: efflux RND transporter periplasmic adaptor subunit [Bacteroidales bacterium]|jgi:RND family efflux transporter MFP subunit|nr:efflux RND transporter periplasmic adaptor subunit [Bacteroidales bacterium]